MAGGLDRIEVRPIAVAEVPVDTNAGTSEFWQPNWPAGTERRVLARDETMTGGVTMLLTFPAGYHRPLERQYLSQNGRERFEYHTMHEEVFIIDGTFRFGDWYDLRAPGYFNHPESCLHPANQSTDNGATLLIKNSGLVDFHFEEIPDGWDPTIYPFAGDAPRSDPVLPVNLDEFPWQPVLDPDGKATGQDAKTIWYDVKRGWTTWLMRVPAGWEGSGNPRQMPGGDEFFLLDGDFSVAQEGEAIRLAGQSYYCAPNRFVAGGRLEGSEAGCTAVRWTRDTDLVLPDSIT